MSKSDKTKTARTTIDIQNIRVCNMVFIPLNQFKKIAKEGCYIPVLKQSVSSDVPRLTKREYECLQFYVDGYNTKSIAQLMELSTRRIQNIMESLRQKFNVNTDNWLVSRYYQLGMDAISR